MKSVYFMRPVGQLGPVKIGCSKMPELRLDSMTIWSPVRLEIVVSVPGTHSDEAALHGMFRKHHLHGEWFGASKELLALIDHCRTAGSLPDLPKVVPFRKTRHVGHLGRAKATPCEPRRRIAREMSGDARQLAQAMRNSYDGGKTLHEVADEFNWSVATVRKLIQAVGGATRKRGRSQVALGVQDPGRAEKMAARYSSGATLQEIGDEFGVTRERARQVLRKFGVPSAGHRPEHMRKAHDLTPNEIEAARLYDEGKTRPALICERLGVSLGQIYGAVKRCGYSVKPQGYFLTFEDDEKRTNEIAALYARGVSAKEIAATLDYLKHPETVYRYLKKAGVTPRLGNIRKCQLDDRADEVIAMCQVATITDVAAHYGVSCATVASLLRRHGATANRAVAEAKRVAAVRIANARRWATPTEARAA